MNVYFKPGATDMRKSINTLSVIVQDVMKLDPFAASLFVFCNKRKEIIKVLYWDKNGFCLWQKRLEGDKFRWPKDERDALQISQEEFRWFLHGLDITTAHQKKNFFRVS
jgi:transposase